MISIIGKTLLPFTEPGQVGHMMKMMMFMVMMRIGFSKLSTKATFHAFAIIISCFRSGHMGLEILSQRSAGKNADSECSYICVFEGYCCVQHNRGRQALSGF